MNALTLSDDQLAQLRACAAALPVQMRDALLRLVCGYLETEGNITDAAVSRAIAFAMDVLPATDGASVA